MVYCIGYTFKPIEDHKLQEFCGTQIPENEMKVLSNGRLTCLICPSRPIFDTLNVLLVHRNGKKHAAENDLYLARKEEIKVEKLKQNQKFDSRKQALHCERNFKKIKLRKRPRLEIPSILNETQKISNIDTPNSSTQSDVIETKPVSSVLHKSSSKKNKMCPQKISSNLRLDRSTQLIMTGWMKDSFGKWVKDPNAEFDSDESDHPPEVVDPD